MKSLLRQEGLMMSNTSVHFFDSDARSDWVRLRTLILLRWMAIIGQSAAVLVAVYFLALDISIILCFSVIGASAVANIIAITQYPENKRLTDKEAMFTLLFDLTQLIFLLFLTGGLNNPFALLILAPVTISATTLRLRSTIFLGVCAIVMVTIVTRYHIPLKGFDGHIYELPLLFTLGFWNALIIGILFLASYARRVSVEAHSMNQALLATQMALDREQKLTDLGGVVAAAAHELGTPLATIKLVSTELEDELEKIPELKEDAKLIREQANRCNEILKSMGSVGKEDLHLRSVPITEIVRQAAEPHLNRGKEISFTFYSEECDDSKNDEPIVERSAQIIHGLRNLIQNAVDFSFKNVWIDVNWSKEKITVRVVDDGEGFSLDMLGQIGEPFITRRDQTEQKTPRPEYEGMGLGVFIAKTLLERSGASLSFSNNSDSLDVKDFRNKGAIVEVHWPSPKIALKQSVVFGPLGENKPIN
jgi:two-component system sensor histidine kinase RegB